MLLQTHLDIQAYYMTIGRNLNGRLFDSSPIFNAPEPERFLTRALTRGEETFARQVFGEARLPIFVTHDALWNARIFFDIFPDAKMLQIVRDPVTIVQLWHRRLWGRRIGVDKRAFDINFSRRKRSTPWFALDWTEDYQSLAEFDRVLAVRAILAHARAEYDVSSAEIRSQILFVTYEEMLLRPLEAVERISRFLDRPPSERMSAVLARERLPRPEGHSARERALEEFSVKLTPARRGVLAQLAADYDHYWVPLASVETPAAADGGGANR